MKILFQTIRLLHFWKFQKSTFFTLKQQMVKLARNAEVQKSDRLFSHGLNIRLAETFPDISFFLKKIYCWLAAQWLAWEFNIFTTYKSTLAQNILYEELYRPVGCRISTWEEKNKLQYVRHYNPRLVYFLPYFKDHFFVFKEVFSENSVLMNG